MIKVVKDNTTKQAVCSRCISVLEYDSIKDPFCDDIQYNEKLKASIYSWYINCPKCGQKIKVEERLSR